MGGCCGEGIPACEHVFDRRTADADLRQFRRDGPTWATRALVGSLAEGLALSDLSVIDIGAGVGAVHIGLLERGARSAVDVDGSSAYLDAAREEAVRRGLGDKVTYVLGDVTAVTPALGQADLVALDRVVCCYPDAIALMRTAASLAVRRIGFVCPRDAWWLRAGVAVANPVMFRRSAGYRMHVHRSPIVTGPLIDAGFRRLTVRDGRVWRIETWERAAA